MKKKRITLTAMLLVACGTVPPAPPQPAPPSDVFDGAIVNCETPAVAEEMLPLTHPVRGCLLTMQQSVDCLLALTAEHTVDGIACTVRQLGKEANRAVLAEYAGDDDRKIDDTARWFINARKVGFR